MAGNNADRSKPMSWSVLNAFSLKFQYIFTTTKLSSMMKQSIYNAYLFLSSASVMVIFDALTSRSDINFPTRLLICISSCDRCTVSSPDPLELCLALRRYTRNRAWIPRFGFSQAYWQCRARVSVSQGSQLSTRASIIDRSREELKQRRPRVGLLAPARLKVSRLCPSSTSHRISSQHKHVSLQNDNIYIYSFSLLIFPIFSRKNFIL